MSKEQLLSALKSQDSSVEKQQEVNPYSQEGLADHIEKCGFPMDEIVDISAIANALKQNRANNKEDIESEPEDTRNHLSLLHKHLAKEGKLPTQDLDNLSKPKEKTPINKQLNMKAMEHIIAKYKGKK